MIPKLVRDNVVGQMRARGMEPTYRNLPDDECYVAALAVKLIQEAREFETSLSMEELADVDEVVRALAHALSSLKHLKRVRKTKAKIKGKFAKRVFLESWGESAGEHP